jgi:hypothetical protein
MSAKDALSKNAITTANIKGKILSFIGWIIAGFFGFCFFGGIFVEMKEDKAPGLIFCFICMVIGVLFLIGGTRITNTVKRCRKYADIISDQNEANVYSIASILSQPVDFIMTDLQKMISKGFFIDACLDKNAHRIWFRDRTNSIPASAVSNSAQEEVDAITCTGCGARVQIARGSTGKCEYCGSSITV